MSTSNRRSLRRGISLIELIIFIVGIVLAGILLVMNAAPKKIADPLVHKQALAIAESLLEEVELMPVTFCEPDDANAASAVSAVVGAGGCAATVEAIGKEVGEARHGSPAPFDNVNDYHGFSSVADGGIKDIAGNAVAGLAGYAAKVSVTNQSMGGIPAAESLLIAVTVTGPDGVPVVVEGVRTRYAPNALP